MNDIETNTSLPSDNETRSTEERWHLLGKRVCKNTPLNVATMNDIETNTSLPSDSETRSTEEMWHLLGTRVPKTEIVYVLKWSSCTSLSSRPSPTYHYRTVRQNFGSVYRVAVLGTPYRILSLKNEVYLTL